MYYINSKNCGLVAKGLTDTTQTIQNFNRTSSFATDTFLSLQQTLFFLDNNATAIVTRISSKHFSLIFFFSLTYIDTYTLALVPREQASCFLWLFIITQSFLLEIPQFFHLLTKRSISYKKPISVKIRRQCNLPFLFTFRIFYSL